jgi:DNA-binding NarL/FixJ family response regulator
VLILEAAPDIDVVGEASDGEQAVDLAARLRPDVVLMDVRMPRLDGIAATRRITSLPVLRGRCGTNAPTAVLILTTFDLDEYVFGALRAGAAGFVLKDIDADGLVEAVRLVARGDGIIAPSLTRRLIAAFADRPDPNDAPDLSGLSERELDVLDCLGAGLSNAEVAERLAVAESTVKTHVSRILAKLGLKSRVQAAIVATSGRGAADRRR